MSNENINNDNADDEKDQHRQDFGVENNPNGPWANLKNENLQNAIVRLAGEHHRRCAAENPKLGRFADFLDAFASAWLEQKAHVEQEAQKYGFAPCESTTEIPHKDRHKAALLCLTLNGSFVLLGNGCLASSGGSGHYEKIPFRADGSPTKVNALLGVVVNGEAAIHNRLYCTGQVSSFIGNTSALQALYCTTDELPPENALQLGQALSESVSHFSDTIRFSFDESLRWKKEESDEPHPEFVPEEQPELEPVYQ